MPKLSTQTLLKDSAHQLAPLIAAHAQEQNRGAPRNPDEYYAECLIEDPATTVLGGFLNDELVGFCLFFDLPETITGMRNGQIGDIYVKQSNRGEGVGQALMKSLIKEGEKRDWLGIRIAIPSTNKVANSFIQKFAETDDYKNCVIHLDNLIRRG